jgi:hypothetical protein
MTAQKLYETLKFLEVLDRDLNMQKTLESIRDALNNLVSQPADPQQQAVLAQALQTFSSSAEMLGERITPSQATLISAIGGQEFFEPSIAESVKSSVATNAMTPTVARDFVKGLASRRAAFMATIKSTQHGLTELKIGAPLTVAGTADVAFLIPRDIFENQLGTFAKELTFINSLIRDVSEAKTGHADVIEVKELSSSVPTVALAARVNVVEAIAGIVNKFLDAWKKIEEIRDIRQRLAKVGMKRAALEEELDEQITTTIEEVVEESTTTLLVGYQGDSGRRNELSTALTREMTRLFGQIERGLTLEFHAEPEEDGEAEKGAVESLSALNREIRFPAIENQPLLLTNGEVVEGPIERVKVFTRTTTRKTTKKETHKEPNPEPKAES